MAKRTAVTAVVALMFSAAPVWAYELTNLGSAGGWDDINKSTTTTAVLDTSDYTTDVSFGTTDAALRGAFATWDNVTEATGLNFQFKSDDGGNYDLFDGPGGAVDYASDYLYANITIGGWLAGSYFTDVFGSSGANVLAVTWTARVGRGRNTTWVTDIYFNESWKWSSDGTGIDIETVALHEIGHALGFDHEDDVPSVMASYYAGIQRDLFPDDIAGLIAVYGESADSGGKPGRGGPKKLSDADSPAFTFGADGYLTGVTLIPEPASAALLLIGGVVLVCRRKR